MPSLNHNYFIYTMNNTIFTNLLANDKEESIYSKDDANYAGLKKILNTFRYPSSKAYNDINERNKIIRKILLDCGVEESKIPERLQQVR